MDAERVTRWSGIPREVNPALPNHRAILVFSALVGVLAVGYAWLGLDRPLFETARWGVGAATSTFVTWVIGRELDPDHPASALLGAAISLPLILALGLPHLLFAFWIVLLLRVVNRTTGLAAQPLDTVLVVGLTVWLALSLHSTLLLMAAVALWLDGFLQPGHRLHRIVASVLAVVWVVSLLLAPLRLLTLEPGMALVGAGVGTVLYLIMMLALPPPSSVGDYTAERLSAFRVRAAQLLAPALAWALVVLRAEGLQAALTLWAAILGNGAFLLMDRARRLLLAPA